MGTIRSILTNVDVISVKGSLNKRVGNICFDSRKAAVDDVFVAVKGTRVDGHIFIPEMTDKGIKVIVCEKYPDQIRKDCCYIQVADSQKALAVLSSNYFENPSGRISLVGVTGTNGKTTVASLLYKVFTDLGFKCGLLSTIKTVVAGKVGPATHSTPDPLQINRLLSLMTDEGCKYAFMEVSSHAAHQKRIAGLTFRGAVFTNLTHDHLDYHGDFSSYRDAKKSFFDDLPETAFALINADDRNANVMIQNTKAVKNTYGIKSMADFRLKVLESHLTGNLLRIENRDLWTRLPGTFNAYNVLAVYGTSVLLGAEKERVLESLSKQEPIEGRFQVFRSEKGVTAIVDYAHSPDALKNVLDTIREIKSSEAKIISVVGAGGNRDRTKRPLMARITATLSDKVILTTDNPRFEEPESIINEMKTGLDHDLEKKVITITDRREAIRTACSLAGDSDIILVAGKGHETYQEIKGIKYHFDDRETIKECLNLN